MQQKYSTNLGTLKQFLVHVCVCVGEKEKEGQKEEAFPITHVVIY